MLKITFLSSKNGFSIESNEFQGNAITIQRTSAEIAIKEMNNSTMDMATGIEVEIGFTI